MLFTPEYILFLQAVTRFREAPGEDEEKQGNKHEKYVSHKCFERNPVPF
jgi:hypothetical protein